jgi:CRISPR-associated endonuclease/helicase Cas3
MTFRDFFSTACGDGLAPYPYQERLARDESVPELLDAPTGLGKTAAAVLAWVWRRRFHQDESVRLATPRRLVYCLPMRVLVEQTLGEAEKWLRNLGLLAETPHKDENDARAGGWAAENRDNGFRIAVHLLMGGEDETDWALWPERDAILIGTQDMLLSRALNRGYAASRARWPMEFGLLNNDCLWVFDELQLMDVGLATSAQMQAFREQDRGKSLRPCHTCWMSATLQPEWLKSVDTAPYHEDWIRDPCTIEREDRKGGLWEIRKSLAMDVIGSQNDLAFAQRILSEHANVLAGNFGRISLVVCNTVDRACRTFDSLRTAGRKAGLELVHSRFRSVEREEWRTRFLSRSACTTDVDRIIVATQVVEAGVDLTAGCLITELAPWTSLVQRFGRCARYGGNGKVLVVDRGRDESVAAPYRPDELESAWEALEHLAQGGVSLVALKAHEESLSPEARRRLYPFEPAHLLLRREFDELFDTTADLTGADLDISRFIRAGDEHDLQLFWLDLAKDEMPSPKRRPRRRELCSVKFLKVRDWLCGEEKKNNRKPKLRGGMRAWVWDWIDGEWKWVTREALLPGRVVCVSADSGGYSIDRGFDPESTRTVLIPQLETIAPETEALDEADNQQDGEQLSFNSWKTIACHTAEVASEVGQIARQLGLSMDLQDTFELAALWHDWGKAHPAFQGSIRDGVNIKRLDRQDLAKAPDQCWPKKYRYQYLDYGEQRPAFRHELASALGLFAILETYAPRHPALLGQWGEVLDMLGKSAPFEGSPAPPSLLIERLLKCKPETFDLVAYLVASHHGKVRVGLHAAPQDQDYRAKLGDDNGLPIRGIREGDRLPPAALATGEPPLPAVVLTLSPAAVGLSCRTGASWRERCIGLLDRHGPATLAFFEAILRAADVRASRRKSNDPAIASEANA